MKKARGSVRKKKLRNKPQRSAKIAEAQGGASQAGDAPMALTNAQAPTQNNENLHTQNNDEQGAIAKRVGVVEFLYQVRTEIARVVWPTRNETIVTTIMVFIMVTLAALFFLAADQLLSLSLGWLLGAFR